MNDKRLNYSASKTLAIMASQVRFVQSFQIKMTVENNRIYPEESESASEFTARVISSRTFASDWIQCHNRVAEENKDDENLASFVEEAELILSVLSIDRASTTDLKERKRMSLKALNHLYQLASTKKILSGKWVLFRNDADQDWRQIAALTMDGELGSSAKVSTNNGQNYLICVYVSDCRHS